MIYLIKLSTHVFAFYVGITSMSWTLMLLCVGAHYFVAPSIASSFIGDIKNADKDGFMAYHGVVVRLTIVGSLISCFWYLAGLGIGTIAR
jgi:hypothetical protein